MKRHVVTTISEYPLPDSLSTEMQVIADIISLPETLMEAERIITPSMFSDDRCRDAFNALRAMSHEGMIIDLPSAYDRIGRQACLTASRIPSLLRAAFSAIPWR